jgi:cytochrome d ubiquinol oxidase subunit II
VAATVDARLRRRLTGDAVVLGMAGAALASGRIRVLPDGSVEAGLWSAWTGPLSIVAGALALAMCAYLAAVYLTVEADARGDAELARLFRRGRWGGDRRRRVGGGRSRAVALDAPDLWAGMRGARLAAGAPVGGRRAGLPAADPAAEGPRGPVAAAVAVGSVVAGWGWPSGRT